MKPKFTVSEWVKNNLKRSHKIEVSKFSNLFGIFTGNYIDDYINALSEIREFGFFDRKIFLKRKLMISTENPEKLHEALEGIFRYSALLMSLSGFALFEFGHFILLALPSAGSSRDA